MFLIALLLLSLIEPVESSIEDLKDFGRLYKVCATFLPVKALEKGCLYRILDESGEIKGVSFYGQCISGYRCVYGRLEMYRGEKELVILSDA